MASVFVVENDLKDSVAEYGQIIDTVAENNDFSASLKPHLDETSNQILKPAELASKLIAASSAATLTKLSDKEFEPAFYLLVYLLNELESVTFDQLVQKDSNVINLLIECTPAQAPSLRDRRSLKPTTILSIITTFFNYLPAESATRVYLVELILNTVSNSNIDFALVQSSVGDNMVGWLQSAGADDSVIKRLFWFFVRLDQNYTLKTLHLIKSFTSTYTVSLAELHELIQFALASSVVDVSFLVNNNVANALHENSSDELAQTFVEYTRGDLVTNAPGTNPEKVRAKSRILALAKFFVASDDAGTNQFLYGDIPSELVSSPAEFETLLIDLIKAGVIEGKLNQVDETFYLVRVNRFVLAGDKEKIAHDWATVRQALVQWQDALHNINDIVQHAKDAIVNSSAS